MNRTLKIIIVFIITVQSFVIAWLWMDRNLASASTEARLFSLAVHSRRPIEISIENGNIKAAAAKKEAWTRDPLSVAQLFVPSHGRLMTWSLRGQGQSPDKFEIIAIADGFFDDSVQGERTDLILQKDHNGVWQAVKADISWRCWEHRGHQDFSVTPCS